VPGGAGTVLTNKYAEVTRASVTTAMRVRGCAGSCDRSREEALGADYANVQPHSGSREPGRDWRVEARRYHPGMSRAMAAILAHGASVNLSGKPSTWCAAGLDANEAGSQQRAPRGHKPKMIVAASAYALRHDWAKFARSRTRPGRLLRRLALRGPRPSTRSESPIRHQHTHKGRGRAGASYRKAEHEKAPNSAIFPDPGRPAERGRAKAVRSGSAAAAFKDYQRQVLLSRS
jgi:glycine/serine hydroxymethyltransferase